MKKARFVFRLLKAFLSRHLKIVLAGFVGGSFFFLILPGIITAINDIKETKTIGIVGRYTTSQIPIEIQSLISYGLTKMDKNGEPLPALASEWYTENDGKTYVFKLNNSTWQDKTPVKAEDVNYNFKDVTVTTEGKNTIKYALKEPFAPFPSIVSRPVFKKGLVGLGKYTVKKMSLNGQNLETIDLKTSDRLLPNLSFRFYPTDDSVKTAFKLGEIREIKNVNSLMGFENEKNIIINNNIRYDRYVGLFFNISKPLFVEKSFRQALAYATPKFDGDRALGPISPLSWAYNGDVKPYDYDLKYAQTLIDKVLEGKKDVTRIKISTVTSLLPEAEEIRKSWEQLGLKVEIGSFSSVDNDFDVLLATQEIADDPDQYNLWHSTQETNITHFKNPRIDKLLEDGRKTMNKEVRKNIYFDFQRFLVEEVPAIFLYHPVLYDILRP